MLYTKNLFQQAIERRLFKGEGYLSLHFSYLPPKDFASDGRYRVKIGELAKKDFNEVQIASQDFTIISETQEYFPIPTGYSFERIVEEEFASLGEQKEQFFVLVKGKLRINALNPTKVGNM